MLKPLLLWSGGLDSTWALRELGAINALSIALYTHGEQARATREAEARARLRPHFPSATFHDAALDISASTMGTLDTINAVFIAAQMARSLGMNARHEIWLGANCDDDAAIQSSLENRRECWDRLLWAVYRGGSRPRIVWPDPAPSRLQQLQDLGSLADQTWSCRDPKPHECGACKPCLAIHAARRQLNGDTP